MAAHKTNSLLKYVISILVILVLGSVLWKKLHQSNTHPMVEKAVFDKKEAPSASTDSAAESLDTLTAELANTKKQMTQITEDNAALKNQNAEMLKKLQGQHDSATASIAEQVEQLKAQVLHLGNHDNNAANPNISQPITTVPDLTEVADGNTAKTANPLHTTSPIDEIPTTNKVNEIKKPIPYYTIPANATAVRDQLMTALVGRIPVKGVVTDPYPFKIVLSDDTLAANGLRVPHLKQMIVSGYAEGDLNLLSVRGWITSLTFVFEDGTISTTTSNNNDIGHFTKENALGFLSDPRGNPFIRGKLITNAPSYLSGNILLGAAQGAASAYAQTQTTNQVSPFGSTTSSVTGSANKYVLGQAGMNAASQAQQWWHDREENSFDAIYVSSGQEIVVNFSKEIAIDYNPIGRKIAYENSVPSVDTPVVPSLD